MKKITALLLQIGALVLFSWLGNLLADWLHLPIPGTLVAILLVFALLHAGVLKLSWLEAGADFLIANLVLFFIPSAVVLMKHTEYLASHAVGIALVVVLGTFLIMALSGTLTERLINKRKDEEPQ
ncbi:CidA/LrgA family holin-like protein [Gorillibacterium sp. CAU 1737]|uniref:CidA/LrgA family holin-like protein n=1 Tax=Gorillibacterium sp. CAU 1737 TaxID=3140362 RepID=UPI00326029E3